MKNPERLRVGIERFIEEKRGAVGHTDPRATTLARGAGED